MIDHSTKTLESNESVGALPLTFIALCYDDTVIKHSNSTFYN
jgi:hypothetical protein